MGLSIAKPFRIACWQKVDFPEPGGPTNNIRFLGGMSCSWLTETTRPHLPEFPFAVGVPHCNALDFFDMLVFDGGEEAVEEARGEEAGGFLKPFR